MKSVILLCSLAAAFGSAIAAPASTYHLAREVKIGGDGGWDYVSADNSAHRLFVTHGTRVEVLDSRTLSRIGDIPDTPGVHGVAIASDLGHGYISAGTSGSIVVFDLKSLARTGEIHTTGAGPDAILYEPNTHRVFSFNGRGRNITAVDAVKNEVVGTIPLDAKPEFAVSDASGQIYVNLEDKNSIAVIDPRTLAVVKTWPLQGCEEPSGLAIDRAHHRLFSVCSNEVMDVVDSGSGRVVATLPIGKNVDGAAFDATAQLAFASAGEGKLTIVKEQTPDNYSVVQTVSTRTGARTLAVDESTHSVYLPTASLGPPPPATAERPHPRPSIVPDTFVVLVVQP
jgi:DNA-binding beta-propeller fold protein YncE